MDMWNPYRAAVKAVLPQARIVVDKFHVVRMANDALERVRKGLRKEPKPSQSRTLKGDRKILLKRAHEVSDRERLIMETGQARSRNCWPPTSTRSASTASGTPPHGSAEAARRVDSHHPEGPKGSLERSGQGSGKLARRDHDLLRDGHARHQRLHGVHQPTGQGQEP